MRRVYTPPTSGGRWYSIVAGALLITLLVFLVLPLTQMVSSHVQRQKQFSKIDTTSMAPPPPSTEPPPPPPPEEEEQEEPKPELNDAPRPLDLNFDLDVAVGSGGALASLGSENLSDLGGGLANMAFDMSDLDKQPVLMASVSPRYPADMRKNKIEGAVVILFLLNETGQVEDPRVEKSSRPEFELPALEAVKKWKFKPGQREGEPVRTYMRLPIRFSMSSST
jgi:protein TonB